MRPAAARRRGAALIQALLLLVVATAVAAGAAARVQRTVDATVLDRAEVTAAAAASGGVELARAALARDAAWTGGTRTLGGSEIEVRVSAGASDAERHVVVVARAVRATQRVEAELRLDAAGLPRVVAWREED